MENQDTCLRPLYGLAIENEETKEILLLLHESQPTCGLDSLDL